MISNKLLFKLIILPVFLLTGMGSCDESGIEEEEVTEWQQLTVTASAYNSLQKQAEGNPKITAWGDTLKPGVQSIAVSRDLIKKGLDYKTKVKIEGFDGTFVVNDKMHSRWKNKIDIYMGLDRERAVEWGRRKVSISFPAEAEEESP